MNLNHLYKIKFGFPFVICARLNKADKIIHQMEKRLKNSKEEEIKTGIGEMKKICKFRGEDLIAFDANFCNSKL